MHLLQLQDGDEFSLVEFPSQDVPPYAILSHTWGAANDEVIFQDLKSGVSSKRKKGFVNLLFCGKQAAKDGLKYFWVDSCCIDKTSSAELQEAITSMFQWYNRAAKCYVYLSDVSIDSPYSSDLPLQHSQSSQQPWLQAFQNSRWFSRGWTLQELLAPASVQFYSAEGHLLGDKISLLYEIYERTGIPVPALKGDDLSGFSTRERMTWARDRKTKREEDAAYSLLGIFQVYLPLIYGEGRERALYRLQREIEDFPRFVASKSHTKSLSLHDFGSLRKIPGTWLLWEPSAVVYEGKLYLFHHGLDNSGTMYYNVFDGVWYGEDYLEDTTMSSGPSAVVYEDKIYCFHQGPGECGELWYNVFDGTWQDDVLIPETGMSCGPSAVVYGDKLFCFHQGGGRCGELWYNVFDGSKWLGDVRVPRTGMSFKPSAVVYRDKLYCFHHGLGICGELWYNVFDGSKWLGDVRVPDTSISFGPSAVVYGNDKLYCFHQGGDESGEIWCNVFDGRRWQGDTRIPAATMSFDPSVVVYDDDIYYFHHGANGRVWYGTMSGISKS